jgi:hypothetical protein
MSKQQYKVTVQFPAGVFADQRIRAGVVVNRVHGYVGELTDEQLAAIKADQHLSVEKYKGDGSEGGDAGNAGGDEAPTDPESDFDRLMKKTRPKLNKLAKKEGVEKPEELGKKEDVVNAILNPQGEDSDPAGDQDGNDDPADSKGGPASDDSSDEDSDEEQTTDEGDGSEGGDEEEK